MNEYMKIFLSSMLIDNVVLIQFLALCPFIGMTTDTGKAVGMGIATSFVMVLDISSDTGIHSGYCQPSSTG